MKYGLGIRPDGALDFAALGALVHRLDPGVIPFRKANECRIHVSGGEFNVAANLADCFRLRTGIVTAMVDYPIGDLVAERVRAMGVRPFYKHFAHDGATKLLDQWKVTLNAGKQRRIATQLQKIFLDQMPIVPLFIGPRWSTYSTKYFHCFDTPKNFFGDPIFTTFPDNILSFTRICPGGRSG